MTIDSVSWLTSAFVVGLFSAGHCLPMCGGISSALGHAHKHLPTITQWKLSFGYSVGRVFTYALLGAAVGALTSVIQHGTGAYFGAIIRTIPGVMLVAMGLYLGRWWLGITRLERLGAGLWKRLSPTCGRLGKVHRLGQAMTVGMIWGMLPCGLVYSALTVAASRTSVSESMLMMTAFGFGTLPSTILPGVIGPLLASNTGQLMKKASAVLMVLLGLWVLVHNGLALWPENDLHQHHHHAPTHSH